MELARVQQGYLRWNRDNWPIPEEAREYRWEERYYPWIGTNMIRTEYDKPILNIISYVDKSYSLLWYYTLSF